MQAAKRTTSALAEGEESASKKAKVASPAGGAWFSSRTPTESSERRGPPSNLEVSLATMTGPKLVLPVGVT